MVRLDDRFDLSLFCEIKDTAAVPQEVDQIKSSPNKRVCDLQSASRFMNKTLTASVTRQ
jgi:hypothetical protein